MSTYIRRTMLMGELAVVSHDDVGQWFYVFVFTVAVLQIIV